MLKHTPTKVKVLNPDMFEMYKDSVATDGSAGFDLRIATSVAIEPNETVMVGTGIAVAIPVGWVGLLAPRSSTGKLNIVLANTIGVIDSDYRGEIKLLLKNTGKTTIVQSEGRRLVQMIVVPANNKYEFVELLDETERGDGGFGHSGEH